MKLINIVFVFVMFGALGFLVHAGRQVRIMQCESSLQVSR